MFYPITGLKRNYPELTARAQELPSINLGEYIQCPPIQKLTLLAVEEPSQDYGNKYANLKRLDRLVKAAGLEGVEVPAPYGISSKTIENFIKEQGFDILPLWEKLQQLGTLDDVLLEAIRGNISQAFEKGKLDTPWLDEITDYLMVRSTGMEDGLHTANAGGNISKAYVSPDNTAFCAAAKEVILSYFSRDSLQNLLNAKVNPLAQKPSLAVMAQRLIGEEENVIPISLVLFSNEPLYVGKENFRCMKISACYGHGEGVVGNEDIGTDSVLLLVSETDPEKLYVIYTNGDKPQRLAPVGGMLASVDNPPHLRKQFIFNENLLARLYALGVLVEQGFNHPVDMEIVIKGDTLYPVQARPVNRPQLNPTYLDLRKTSPALKTLQGETLVAGTASAVAAKPHEICFAPTLKEAEKRYKGEKCVIVSAPEPANSHPIVNFSGLGVPCLRLNHLNPSDEIVLCIQEGTANLWHPSYGRPEDFISEGFTTHPAPISFSFDMGIQTKGKNRNVPKEIKELLLLARGTREVALKALEELHAHPYIQNINPLISKKIEAAFKEAAAAIRNSEERLRTLFHVKVLQTLLVDKPYIEDARELAAYQAKFKFPVRFASIYLAGNAAFDPAAKERWRAFLENLERSEAPDQNLIPTIHALDSANLLPMWFAFFFNENNLEFPSFNLPSIKKTKIAAFSTLNTFPGAFQKLQELTDKVIAQNCSSLLMLNTVSETVDLFDLCIKELKKTGHIPHFKKMISAYFALLRNLIEKLPNAQSIPMNNQVPLRAYLREMEAILEKLPIEGAEQLLPSKSFSVAAAAIGSTTFSQRHPPHTLEDFFTLVHQNLLAVIAHCTNLWLPDEAIAKSALPSVLKKGMQELSAFKRTGMVFSDQTIQIRYNIPLRNHSAQLNLAYDLTGQELTLQTLLLGINENNRWGIVSHLVQTLDQLGICPLHSPVQVGENELSVTWKAGEGKIPALLKLFEQMRAISFLNSSYEQYRDDFIPSVVVHTLMENYQIDKAKVAELASNTIFEFLLFKLNNEGPEALFWARLALRDKDPVIFEHFVEQHVRSAQPFYSQLIPQFADLKVYGESEKNSLAIVKLYLSMLYCDRSQADTFKEFFSSLVITHIKSPNPALREKAFELLHYLDAPDLQLECAKNGLNDPHSLKIFTKLVKAGHYLPEAMAAAEKGGSYSLYSALIEKGWGYEQAARFAEKEQHLPLFIDLVEQGIAYGPALAAAQRAKNENSFDVYRALVKKGLYYDQAKAALCPFTKSEKALLLLNALVDSGEAIPAAVQVASQLIQDNYISRESLKLLTKLKEKGESTDKFIAALNAKLKSDNWHVKQIAQETLEEVYKC